MNEDIDPQKADRIRLIGSYDQLGASLEGFAEVLANYHKSLVTAGLSHEQATQIVRDFHMLWWQALVPVFVGKKSTTHS